MRVVALKNHRYGGAGYRVGDAYEAQEKYAKALILANVVRPESSDDEAKPKRRYKRRDMAAEA